MSVHWSPRVGSEVRFFGNRPSYLLAALFLLACSVITNVSFINKIPALTFERVFMFYFFGGTEKTENLQMGGSHAQHPNSHRHPGT